ncbi:hypothetical protein [Nonomuraea sp. NEAU-A123]|uniref:hypothetical protein n=1 Tax=Nonomuraea sp. NEAU-A123 TaxID=2839649 RepID=UPI0027E1C44D|nr:hypothetical protein [Nonomuraea sp. NEAU-A123]
MKSVLERLGCGPCHHMMEVVQRPGQVRRWGAMAKMTSLIIGSGSSTAAWGTQRTPCAPSRSMPPRSRP